MASKQPRVATEQVFLEPLWKGKGVSLPQCFTAACLDFIGLPERAQIKLDKSALRNPVPLPEVGVPMDLGNPRGTPLQGHVLRKIPGAPDPSQGPGLSLDRDPEEVPEGITLDHVLGPALTDAPEAGHTVENTEGDIATVTLQCLPAGVMWGIGPILIPTVVSGCLD